MQLIEVTPETGPLIVDRELTDAYVKVIGPVAGISLVDPRDVTLSNVTVDCIEVPRGYNAHGVRVTGTVENTWIRNVWVFGSSHYGFGFQHVRLIGEQPLIVSDCMTFGSEADGFDVKVHSQGQVWLHDCVAADCPVGFDLRGSVDLEGCSTFETKTPVRFRHEPVGSPNGLSGSGSVEGFRYRGRKRKVKIERGAGPVIVDGWERIK